MKTYLLAIAAVLAASSANASEVLCSGSGNSEIRMEIADTPTITIVEGAKRVVWDDAGSVGSDMPGRVYQKDGQSEVLQTATVVVDAKEGPKKIRLFQDRAFWPCK